MSALQSLCLQRNTTHFVTVKISSNLNNDKAFNANVCEFNRFIEREQLNLSLVP